MSVTLTDFLLRLVSARGTAQIAVGVGEMPMMVATPLVQLDPGLSPYCGLAEFSELWKAIPYVTHRSQGAYAKSWVV